MGLFTVRRFLPAILFSIGITSFSIAAPMQGETFEFDQPDGSTVPVVVWGDEFYQRVESPDGYTLVRNPATGWICFADLAADSSELVPTERVYRGAEADDPVAASAVETSHKRLDIGRGARLHHRSRIRVLLGERADDVQSSVLPSSPSSGDAESDEALRPLQGVTPVVGNYIGLTILIDFSDKTATVPKDSIADFLNKRGYTGYSNNGSVRDFYFDVSAGKVDYQNLLFGYYRAKQPKTYYDNSSASFGSRAQELILEALNWCKTEGFDFSTLSIRIGTRSKSIRAINILYAGSPSQGWSEGLWPHQGTLTSFTANDVSARKYQISNIGTSIGIGTFCHENGHMLFEWPDLYDYGGESHGAGVYCLMAATGKNNPVPPCAYMRDYAGWDVVTDITDIMEGTVLSNVPNSNHTFTFRNKAKSNEMFYIESKRRSGRFKTLPDSGFMIWHVDRGASNDNEQMTSASHYLVSLEQADNLFQLEKNINQGKAGDLFRKGGKDRFDDSTQPAARWWNNSNSGLKVWNMSAVADTMTFSIGQAASTVFTLTAAAGTHGVINPPGKISVPSGGSFAFAIRPDSGYQIDAITVDGAPATIADTLRFDKVAADKSISVVFGPKSALGIVRPQGGEVFYAADTMTVLWRTRGVTVAGIALSYSTNGGKDFIAVGAALSAADTMLTWRVPVVESDSCIIRVADTDGTPSALSGVFSIRKKPVLVFNQEMLQFTIERGKSKKQELSVTNSGSGDLRISATTGHQTNKVFINELSIGADADAPDAIELLNGGVDIDLSGWQLSWEDNKTTSGVYTFPDGFVLRGGAAFVIDDKEHDGTDSAAYAGVALQWNFSQALELAVTLTDAAGRGVDFVKSPGSAIMPPEGTTWRGGGITLCSAFVARPGIVDRDSAIDWSCTSSGSLRRVNTAQKVPTTAPLFAVTPVSAKTQGGGAVPLSIALDATSSEEGAYGDTLVVYHNDPARPSPLRIPCTITVTATAAVVNKRTTAAPRAEGPAFIAAPNPANPGDRVYFQYRPEGNERSGELVIYNSMGYRLYVGEVSMAGVSAFNRSPRIFSWLPADANARTLRGATCLARLTVINREGKRSVLSTKVGLR